MDLDLKSQTPAKILWDTGSVGHAMKRTMRCVERVLSECCVGATKPPAACFDIDETMLLNHPDGGDRFRSNEPVKRAIERLDELGVTLFAVTARTDGEDSQEYAREQLKRLGFPEFEAIMCFPEEREGEGTASGFKADCRQEISREYNVLLNVGDQVSDMMRLPPVDGASEAAPEFCKRHIRSKRVYGMTVPGDAAILSVKLPNTYTVA